MDRLRRGEDGRVPGRIEGGAGVAGVLLVCVLLSTAVVG